MRTRIWRPHVALAKLALRALSRCATVRVWPLLACAFALCLALWASPGLQAQTAAESASAVQAQNAPAATLPAASGSDADAGTAIGQVESDFGRLRALTYASVLLALAVGLATYLWRRARLLKFAVAAGALVVLLVSVLGFGVLSSMTMSTDGAACSSAVLQTGDQRKRYDDVCRSAREGAANAFGFVSLFRGLFMSAGADASIPVSSSMVKASAWLSVIVMSLAAYFLLQPLVLRLAIKR